MKRGLPLKVLTHAVRAKGLGSPNACFVYVVKTLIGGKLRKEPRSPATESEML